MDRTVIGQMLAAGALVLAARWFFRLTADPPPDPPPLWEPLVGYTIVPRPPYDWARDGI